MTAKVREALALLEGAKKGFDEVTVQVRSQDGNSVDGNCVDEALARYEEHRKCLAVAVASLGTQRKQEGIKKASEQASAALCEATTALYAAASSQTACALKQSMVKFDRHLHPSHVVEVRAAVVRFLAVYGSTKRPKSTKQDSRSLGADDIADVTSLHLIGTARRARSVLGETRASRAAEHRSKTRNDQHSAAQCAWGVGALKVLLRLVDAVKEERTRDMSGDLEEIKEQVRKRDRAVDDLTAEVKRQRQLQEKMATHQEKMATHQEKMATKMAELMPETPLNAVYDAQAMRKDPGELAVDTTDATAIDASGYRLLFGRFREYYGFNGCDAQVCSLDDSIAKTDANMQIEESDAEVLAEPLQVAAAAAALVAEAATCRDVQALQNVALQAFIARVPLSRHEQAYGLYACVADAASAHARLLSARFALGPTQSEATAAAQCAFLMFDELSD